MITQSSLIDTLNTFKKWVLCFSGQNLLVVYVHDELCEYILYF